MQRKLQPMPSTRQVNKYQCSLKNAVNFEGIGVHSGERAQVIVMPASTDAGISFINPMHPDDIIQLGKVLPEKAPQATVLKAIAWQVSTPEHLLAAMNGLGIDNATIEVHGDEVPILDGSALPFVVGFQDAGIAELKSPKCYLAVRQPVVLSDDKGRMLELLPPASLGDVTLHVTCTAMIMGQEACFSVSSGDVAGWFITQLAPARTFGALEQLPGLHALGLAQGSSLDNTVVFQDGIPINPMRFVDEPIRHKLLDVIGDVMVLGKPFAGSINARNPGHMFNRMIVEHYFNNPGLWEMII